MMTLFIIGLFVGCTIGVFIAALCRAAAAGDRSHTGGEPPNEH